MAKRITKSQARKLYKQDKRFYAQACKMPFISVWQQPTLFDPAECKEEGYTFNSIMSAFTYYNCDNERGEYPHFYVD